jgi:hypothetical protein
MGILLSASSLAGRLLTALQVTHFFSNLKPLRGALMRGSSLPAKLAPKMTNVSVQPFNGHIPQFVFRWVWIRRAWHGFLLESW